MVVLFIFVGCSRNLVGDIRLSDQYDLIKGHENCPKQIKVKYDIGIGHEFTFVDQKGHQEGPFLTGGHESEEVIVLLALNQKYHFTYDNDFIGKNELEMWRAGERKATCQYESSG